MLNKVVRALFVGLFVTSVFVTSSCSDEANKSTSNKDILNNTVFKDQSGGIGITQIPSQKTEELIWRIEKLESYNSGYRGLWVPKLERIPPYFQPGIEMFTFWLETLQYQPTSTILRDKLDQAVELLRQNNIKDAYTAFLEIAHVEGTDALADFWAGVLGVIEGTPTEISFSLLHSAINKDQVGVLRMLSLLQISVLISNDLANNTNSSTEALDIKKNLVKECITFYSSCLDLGKGKEGTIPSYFQAIYVNRAGCYWNLNLLRKEKPDTPEHPTELEKAQEDYDCAVLMSEALNDYKNALQNTSANSNAPNSIVDLVNIVSQIMEMFEVANPAQ
jgi:hypothetical protein